jgi:peroxiredoxin Q/BCP
VLYFYPKDFTPACTQEACSFRDHLADFEGLGVEVVGISRDSLKEHDRFRSEHNLAFHLLSDESGDVCAQYDALVPVIRLPKRVTYLLDANHRVAAVVSNMFNARAHIEEMVAHLKKA